MTETYFLFTENNNLTPKILKESPKTFEMSLVINITLLLLIYLKSHTAKVSVVERTRQLIYPQSSDLMFQYVYPGYGLWCTNLKFFPFSLNLVTYYF